MNNIITIVIVLIIIYIIIVSIKNIENYGPNSDTYNHILSPLTYTPGYSGIDDPMFTAHPVKLIDANIPDRFIKHFRLNHTGNPMYWSYYPPTEGRFEKVDCPYNIVDVANRDYPNSRYNLVCWMLDKFI